MRATFDRAALPYWEARSARWTVVAPLAPSEDDVRFYEASAARRVADDGSGLTALLLGVTAPIAAMRWPQATRLVALDWSEGMFRHVWPRAGLPAHAGALRGDWREIPLADASIDFVVGDGCYSTFPDLAGPAALNREVQRILKPGGEFCLRCFCRPDQAVPVATLFEWMSAGRFPNLDLFRWMLAMSVQGDAPEGVSLHRVWRVWREQVPDPGAARLRHGWSEEALANMERWSELESRYVFPTLGELGALAAPRFDLEVCDFPSYPWGERFPRLLMRRREA